jgi:Peroxiredoxin
MNVGDKAPDILGINEKGEEISLSNYRGKKVVLYFYPKDSTSGCTAQACSLRDNYTELRKAGYEVIGVSVDNEKSHQKFIEKNELPFTLIADTRKETGRTIWCVGRKENVWQVVYGNIKNHLYY